MIQFFKDSFRELKHVVWPTREETVKYFVVVLTILVIFWLYLLAAEISFTQILKFIKESI